MATIELRGIRKSFGDTPVLGGIDLTIKEGEFITLVGPSGCGKSTLLRIIAGLETQSSGDVLIADKVVNTVRPADRDLAMVFQNYALYPHLTVRENMLTPLRLRDWSGLERFPVLGALMPSRHAKTKQMRQTVEDVARTLEIEPLLGRKPGQLSGGQRQRAALGRAMVRKPVAFLMDEPLSNLDAALRVHMRSELAELHRSLRTTFIYVTHDQAEALTMSDRMAVMMGGEILQLAPPATVYDDPQDLRVASFVGSPKINTLPASTDSTGHVTALGMTLPINADAAATTVAIRPEHVSVATTGLPLTLSHQENLGADLYLHGTTQDGGHRIIVRSKPVDRNIVAIGDTFHVAFDPARVMLFGADNHRVQARPSATLSAA